MVSRRLTTQANHGNGDAAEDGDDDEGEDDGVGDVMVIITVMMMILLLESYWAWLGLSCHGDIPVSGTLY